MRRRRAMGAASPWCPAPCSRVPRPLSDLGESVSHGERSALSAYRSVRRVLPRATPSTIATSATSAEHPLQLREVPQDVPARPSNYWRLANGQGALLLRALPSCVAGDAASAAGRGSRNAGAVARVSGGAALGAASSGLRARLVDAIGGARLRHAGLGSAKLSAQRRAYSSMVRAEDS